MFSLHFLEKDSMFSMFIIFLLSRQSPERVSQNKAAEDRQGKVGKNWTVSERSEWDTSVMPTNHWDICILLWTITDPFHAWTNSKLSCSPYVMINWQCSFKLWNWPHLYTGTVPENFTSWTGVADRTWACPAVYIPGRCKCCHIHGWQRQHWIEWQTSPRSLTQSPFCQPSWSSWLTDKRQ